jgi:hypothetical protein
MRRHVAAFDAANQLGGRCACREHDQPPPSVERRSADDQRNESVAKGREIWRADETRVTGRDGDHFDGCVMIFDL